jgi:nitroimidazol reductase NimA-like FMN-containing flavoprotein (pyridoxamine 5'-phosphate oxidase superfamily)
MINVRLSKAVVKFLTGERVCRVATIGEGGIPHLVPVCHVVADGKIYFGTGSDSRKVRHLAANPRLALLVDLYAEDWSVLKGVTVEGTSRLIRRRAEFRKIRTLLYQKYPQYPDEAGLDETEDAIVEVTPVRVAAWNVDK